MLLLRVSDDEELASEARLKGCTDFLLGVDGAAAAAEVATEACTGPRPFCFITTVALREDAAVASTVTDIAGAAARSAF